MTRNQIDYHNYKETVRSNRAKEYETTRSNLARETETHRSNVANETETHRSNVTRERETERHNRQDESIRYETNAINDAHFVRMDTETKRHNLANEQLTADSNDISRANVQLGYDNISNSRYMSELSSATSRYVANTNAAASKYSADANMAVGMANVDVNRQAMENLHQRETAKQAEINRHNVATEQVSQTSADAQLMRAGAAALQAETQRAEWDYIGHQRASAQVGLLDAQTKQAQSNAFRNYMGVGTDVYNTFQSMQPGLNQVNNILKTIGGAQ